MVTFAQAQERAEEWVNGDVPAYQHREVRVREFELGFVVWAEDRPDGPRSDGGAQRLVIARDSGEASLWPALPVGEVIRRYEEEYGRPDEAPEPAPAASARVDLNQTSFLLTPPEWLQEAADQLGIPGRRGGDTSGGGSAGAGVGAGASAGPDEGSGGSVGSGAGAGAGAGSGAGVGAGGGVLPETQAGAPGAGSAWPDAGVADAPGGSGAGAGSGSGAGAGAGGGVLPETQAGAPGAGAGWPDAGAADAPGGSGAGAGAGSGAGAGAGGGVLPETQA
ncbi:SUKH-4 family immunity protein, partial [Streptomyces sp. NPDC002776]